MLHSLFLWFYCLPIKDGVLLVMLGSVAYLILRQWLGKKCFWRPVIAVLFFVWLAVIAVATLMDRTTGVLPTAPKLVPFHSYRAVMAGENKEILRSNFMNIVLFYPAGLLAYELMSKGRRPVTCVFLVITLSVLASIGIELCQYLFALGQAEADDVIHNALGALMGAAVCAIRIKRRPGKSVD